jgi:hypothetical protein
MLAQHGESCITQSCTNAWKGSTVAEQVSVMKTAWAIQPFHEWWTMMNEFVS